MKTLIETPCGKIQGVPGKAEGVIAFKGIRYATAGRWEYPKLVTSWEGIYDATHYGPCAMQDSAFVPEQNSGRNPFYYHEFREGLPYTYAEDCLFLNICAPENAQNAPVIVYIHGGAFMGGSGWDKVFDEPHWAQQGVISVTLNYRLGVLGFCCLPELAAEAGHTGNYGLYDQLAALQWVKENISAFGGNPDCITLMGQSAGARSVQFQVGCTEANHLIHRACMSSGGGIKSVLFTAPDKVEDHYDFWLDWKKETGCETLKELREMPVERIFQSFGAMLRKGFGNVMQGISPAYDNAAYPANPAFLKIPYLMGANSEDMNSDMYQDAQGWAVEQAVPSFAYFFDHPLPGDNAGAWHSADLWYWFGTLENCWRPFTDADFHLSQTMQNYLVNFAKTGDPNGENLPVWVPAQNAEGKLMRLNGKFQNMDYIKRSDKDRPIGW